MLGTLPATIYRFLFPRYRYGQRVQLAGDIMSSVKPWDVGRVMRYDWPHVLVYWPRECGGEYHWVWERELQPEGKR